ncbi:hypothetical protein TBCG_03312 [Mycobacterium tuberculosis C]|nr:hypothetical protein TBCG_03312 [Mycobacterium tuberculosis C]
MTLNLSVDEVLTTTRSVRKRLDFDKPVPRDVLMECLELALQAPTGSNSQGWQWVFVEDAAKKKAIADVYLANARGYLSGPAPEYPDGDTCVERMGRVPRFGDLSRRTHAPGAGAADPLPERPGRRVGGGWRVVLGLTVPGGVELLPGVALPRAGFVLDDAAPARQRRAQGGRRARHSLRRIQPRRAASDRLHTRHRLPAGQAAAGR